MQGKQGQFKVSRGRQDRAPLGKAGQRNAGRSSASYAVQRTEGKKR